MRYTCLCPIPALCAQPVKICVLFLLLCQPPVGHVPRGLEDALGFLPRDAGLGGQVVAGDDGMHDFFRLRITNGDTDKMPPAIADGQGQE